MSRNHSGRGQYSWLSCDVIHFSGGQTLNRDMVIGLAQMFTVCVDLVFDSKYVQFRIIH